MLCDQTERDMIGGAHEMSVLDLRGQEADGRCVFL